MDRYQLSITAIILLDTLTFLKYHYALEMKYAKLPFFLGGIGSVLDLYPVPHTYTIRRPFEGLNDAQRLALDWYLVGHSLYSVINSSSFQESTGGKEREPGQESPKQESNDKR
jgi:hypothetical protein